MAEKRSLRTLSQRMNSCIGTPHEEVLAAFNDDNLQLFLDLVHEKELDVNYEYSDQNCSTLLHLCVASGKADFVQEVLSRRDVNPNIPHKILQKFPLHVAVESGTVAIVKLLLYSGADVNSRMGNGSTPLHLAAVRSAARWVLDGQDATQRMQVDFVAIIKMLLNVPGVDVDCRNNIGVTPLYFAVDKGTENVVKELLLAGACIAVEVDDEAIEDLLNDKMPEVVDGLNLDHNRRDTDTIENKLFHLLYTEAYDPGKFMEAWKAAESNNNVVYVNAHNGTYTFLQYCADQGHDKLVRFLLENGAAPNKCSPTYLIPPLVLAGYHGYYKVINVFKEAALKARSTVNFCARDKIKRENVIHKVLKGESRAHINSQFRNYDRCLDILLDDKPSFRKNILPAVNATDQMGNTPIHVAAYLSNDSAVRKLLRCEANVGIKNKKMELPITFISPTVMEEFLDECLQDYGLITDDAFQITFKYSFLGPPLGQSLKIRENDALLLGPVESGDKDFMEAEEEDGDDEEAGNSQDLPEAEPLWYLSQSPDHRQLLAHPVITSFLCLKWRRIRPYYYVNLAFYLLFVTCLTTYLLLIGTGGNPETGIFRAATLILSIALAVRETFQALVSPRRYLFNMENIMEVAMIGISIYLSSEVPIFDQYHRNLAATAILFSWTEMVLMCGRHPKLSTFIKMFSTVSFNFMLFLTWYIAIIVSFGLAFYFVLQRNDQLPKDGGEEANAYFKNPERALLKTIVMSLTGELEFEGIDFGEIHPLFGKVVFLLFVFFIMLVLVNLLNGLAVSDIAVIQKEAEILSYVSRVELIAFIESMLLGDPFHFLTNWPPFARGRALPPCDCFRTLYRVGPIKWLLSKVMGTTLLFSERLVNKKAIFYPNKSNREQSNFPGHDGHDGGSREAKVATDNLILDEAIIGAAKGLLVRRQDNRELSGVTSKLKQIEKSLLLMNQQQNLIIEMMNTMTNKE